MPITRARTVSRAVALLRFIPNSSMKLETTASMTDMALVMAAKRTMAKKSAPITLPIGPIARKTFGRETNIREGPVDMPSMPMKT